MDMQETLTELENVAQGLSVRVCYEKMAGLVQGIGGLCRVRGEYRVIIDRKLKTPERIQVLADALRGFDTQALTQTAAVRKLLD